MTILDAQEWRSEWRVAAGLLAMLAFTTGCACHGTAPDDQGRPLETELLDRAVAAALARTIDVREQVGQCRVIGAQQFLLKGEWIWRITMKPIRFLPDDPRTQPIAAGGEIFVNVDLRTGTSSIGYGE